MVSWQPRTASINFPSPKIDWPAWATDTIHIGRKLTAKDFEILAPAGAKTVTRRDSKPQLHRCRTEDSHPFPWSMAWCSETSSTTIVKVAIVDRYTGKAKLGKMFWTGLGPKTPNSAVATSVSHDLHNITVVGSSDEAMAMAVNRIAEMNGGIVLVDNGKVTAEMRLEIGGLMTSRPIADAAASMEDLYAKSDTMEWIANPGFPKRVLFAMITCSPVHLAFGRPLSRQSLGSRAVANRQDDAHGLVSEEVPPPRAAGRRWPQG